MISGMITRESVFSSLNKGINVKQIISFIESHIDDRIKGEKIPKNIIDQFYIWQKEKLCLKTTKSFFITANSKEEYNKVLLIII